MSDIVYISSCMGGMTEDDVWDWVISNRNGWSFDEITGGKDDFLDFNVYEKLKKRHDFKLRESVKT